MQAKNAPYANIPITLSLSSTVGLKYRTLNCMECGHPFLERNGEQLFHIDAGNTPGAAHTVDGIVTGICGKCTQEYAVTISSDVHASNDVPLYLQPQSFYVAIEPVKKLRNTYCLECGKAFYSISDRIKQVVDNLVPMEMMDVTRLGPMESRCKFQHCQQRWFIRV